MKITLLLLLILIFSAVAFSQVLKADYQFNGNLESSVAGAPDLSNLIGSGENSFVFASVDGFANTQTLRFPFNSGLALFNTNTLIPNGSYTLVALFKFDNYTGLKRVLDFKNGTSQTGAYLLNGRFEAEPTTTPSISPTFYVQAVLVREANGHVRAFRDGILRVDIPNDNGLYLISSANVLRFAQDDFVIGGEASAGNVARIRVYDAPMTDVQAQNLDRLANVRGVVRGQLNGGDGKPARNAVITATDTTTGEVLNGVSNPFGKFNMNNIVPGHSYTFRIKHKRYVFPNFTQRLNFAVNSIGFISL